MSSQVINTLIARDNSFAVNFDIDNYERDTVSSPILNIWKDIIVKIETKEDSFPYLKYQVMRQDSLESLSNDFYQTISLWWLILVVNDVSSPFDFLNDYLNEQKVINILKPKYLPQILPSNKSTDLSKYLGMSNVD